MIEKDIPIDAIEIIPGIINRFCGNIPKTENKNPSNPYSFTRKPTVNPKAKPLNKIVIGIKRIPMNMIPDNHIIPTVLKLSIIDCFNIEVLVKLLPPIALKTNLKIALYRFFGHSLIFLLLLNLLLFQ